jgi:cysteine desulfurase
MMGASQEMDHRAGTENVAGIAGLGKACDLAEKYLESGKSEVVNLRNRLQERILQEIDGAIVNGANQPRLQNTLNVSFKNCASGAMVQELDVLRAMAVPETHIHGTLRISLSRYNTSREVDIFSETLPGIVAKSRQGAAV